MITKKFLVGVAVAWLLGTTCALTQARTVTVTVSFSNAVAIDAVSGQNLPTPVVGTAAVSFDVDGPTTQTDVGAVSIVDYAKPGTFFGATISSSITSLIPQYVLNALAPLSSRAYQTTSDYPDYFKEQFVARLEAGSSAGSVNFVGGISMQTGAWGLHDPRNGDGTSDYFFTPDQTIAFLQSGVGRTVLFTQHYAVFTFAQDGSPIYSDGIIWQDIQATITSVDVSPIPETPTLSLALIGIASLPLLTRMRRPSSPNTSGSAA